MICVSCFCFQINWRWLNEDTCMLSLQDRESVPIITKSITLSQAPVQIILAQHLPRMSWSFLLTSSASVVEEAHNTAVWMYCTALLNGRHWNKDNKLIAVDHLRAIDCWFQLHLNTYLVCSCVEVASVPSPRVLCAGMFPKDEASCSLYSKPRSICVTFHGNTHNLKCKCSWQSSILMEQLVLQHLFSLPLLFDCQSVMWRKVIACAH